MFATIIDSVDDGAGCRSRRPHDFVGAELRAKVGALHVIHAPVGVPLLPLDDVPGAQGRAQRAAGVAGGRLDPDVVKGAFAQQLAVGHAVQGHAAGQAEVSSR